LQPDSYYLLGRLLNEFDISSGPFKHDDPPVDQLYFGAQLSDNGATIQLLDPSGYVIDTANQAGGAWPAGEGYSYYSDYAYCSMERGGVVAGDQPGAWLTNNWGKVNGRDLANNRICGTPGQKNWAWHIAPTPTFTATPSRTPYSYITRTPTRTPKRSPTPTRNPYATPVSNVVINEFLSQPRSDWNGDGEINSGDEFIEIINLGISSVSLSNWSLDDQPGDSTPYTIGNVSIEPGARMAFFSSQTGILLSTGGDSVRLFRSTGLITDAFTYDVIRTPDQSWCRFPDGGHVWVFGCVPTVAQVNKLAPTVIVGTQVESTLCLANTLPTEVQQAECDPIGLSAWDADLWGDESSTYPRYINAGSDVYILE
jgi:hypothetical protein